MSGTLKTIVKIILWVIMGISVVLLGWFYFGPKMPGTAGTTLEEPAATNVALWWSYILFGLAVVVTLLFSFINIFTNKKAFKGALISLLALAILFGVSYIFASDQPLNMPGYEGSGNTPPVLKWVGTGLIAAYLLAGIAFLTILYVEITKLFK